MKIQPRKTASLPKYAAVMAAAVMLTGCGYAGEIEAGGEPQIIDSQVQVEGDMQVCPDETEPVNDEPVQFEGDVALSAFAAVNGEEILKRAGTEHGITLKRADAPAEIAGERQQAWYIDTEKKIIVTFFDADIGLEERYAEHGAEQLDWGFLCTADYPQGEEAPAEYRTALIAASPEHSTISEEEAGQILDDLLGGAAAETEVQSDEN